MRDVERMCGYCWRPGLIRVTRRRNTFWRTLFGRPRPSKLVCSNHLHRVTSDRW